MVKTLWNTDLHAWAFVAAAVIDKRADAEQIAANRPDLDAQADAFLKNHGYGGLARKH
jgi:hypothetical protein